jgi:hypothetical protein
MPPKKSSKAKAKPKNLRPKSVSNDKADSVRGGAFNAYLVFHEDPAPAPPPPPPPTR